MGAKILLAEDDADVAGFLKDFLTLQGHETEVLPDGLQLASLAAERSPQLIITDVQMPGAYGSSAYKTLRQDGRTKDIPVLFISALPVDPVLPQDPRVRFARKPLDTKTLKGMIVELLELVGYIDE